MPLPLDRWDAFVLASLFALVGLTTGLDPVETAAGAAAVFVGVFLLGKGRPPFADVRVPPAPAVAAWSAVAGLAAAVAVLGLRWPFAMLSVAGGASAAVLWRRRRDARRRGLI